MPLFVRARAAAEPGCLAGASGTISYHPVFNEA